MTHGVGAGRGVLILAPNKRFVVDGVKSWEASFEAETNEALPAALAAYQPAIPINTSGTTA